jgi:hypothetical protein
MEFSNSKKTRKGEKVSLSSFELLGTVILPPSIGYTCTAACTKSSIYTNNTRSGVTFLLKNFGTSFVRLRLADWELLKSINLYTLTHGYTTLGVCMEHS